jgi:hypothetical protein
MKELKEILSNPGEAMTIIEEQAQSSECFIENHLNAWMLGTAVSNVKQLANNMNESARKIKKLLNENTFDETTTYELGKCLQLLELDDISLG